MFTAINVIFGAHTALGLANKNRTLVHAPMPLACPFEPDSRRLAIDRLSSKFAAWANCPWVRREVALHLGRETHWAR
jgi:hypothetical protein